MGSDKNTRKITHISQELSLFPEGDHKNSEYDHEIPQSQNGDNSMAPLGRAAHNHDTQGRQTKQSIQLSIPHQDVYKIRMDIK